MPRGIKGSGKGQPGRRGRKPKETLPEPAPSAGPAPDVAAQPPELAEAQAELARKYSQLRIKPGSLRLGAAEGWGNKRIVTIVCGACKVNERVLATSDLFHVSMCEECAKEAKKSVRKAKTQSKVT
jgi:hypothetical protein